MSQQELTNKEQPAKELETAEHSDPISNGKGKKQGESEIKASSQIVTAESVQAEEVPTIPLGSLQTLSTLQPEVSVHSVEASEAVSTPAPLVAQPAEYRRSVSEWSRIWWEGMRPRYLILSIMPFLLGSVLALAHLLSLRGPLGLGQWHPQRFLVGLLAVVLLQLGANLINDYYDYLRGIDTSNTLGPGKLIQQGLIKPTHVLAFGLVLLAGGSLLGLLLALAAGWPLLLFGLLGLLAAYFYSATRRALSSLMLGLPVAFCIYGPLITAGAYYLQQAQLNGQVLLYSLMPGLLATAFVHVNDMRDVEDDAQAGKRTLANTLGLGLNRTLFLALLGGAYLVLLIIGLPHHAPHLALIALWTLPTLVVVVSGIVRTDLASGLHLVLRETLKLEAWFIALLVVGLLLSAILPILPQVPSLALP
ncbi:MAG: 1,4-dihydroxy-2-naphthoate octaprenyltransferase [Thermogemmatispora sp.]|jgi:1,4-dihydroxy-2-naphthoate octaprenyltransferase|uniref:1,4-dihydroxy-2-naphthoate octaprenyltransferase n=1 Tax=Thermogemmatispora sp. TaxID=1968838 RepID=UPI0019EEDD15|nr:1,4-dihydroxy-2-naphthoate octaprenyltransferase [Thermogemmatispora sp.]MBE3567992.1 1,4-dihydroxy-2-naphthoate octaprenyltransferase [Thermogemmatispora sp.]